MAWGYFNGACQGPDSPCSLGGILYITDSHFFQFKASLGRGTNYYGKFMALKYLMKLALEKGLVQLQVLGDSQLVISWMQRQLLVHNATLLPLAEQLKENTSHFNKITFTHV